MGAGLMDSRQLNTPGEVKGNKTDPTVFAKRSPSVLNINWGFGKSLCWIRFGFLLIYGLRNRFLLKIVRMKNVPDGLLEKMSHPKPISSPTMEYR